jgi:hypothetical protein
MLPKFKFVLDQRPVKDGTYPVCLRVTYNYKKRYYRIGYACDIDQWNNEFGRFRKNYERSTAHNESLNLEEKKVKRIIDRLNPFTFERFSEEYRGNKNKLSVFEAFNLKIDKLEFEGEPGGRRIVMDALNSFKTFRKNKNFQFEDITKKFLNKYVSYYKNKNVSLNTIGIRLRTLRQLINVQISEGILSPEFYPFKNTFNPHGFELSKIKKTPTPIALEKNQINLFKNFKSPDPLLMEAKQYFLFSYYGFGINFQDIARITIDDIFDVTIIVERKKTDEPLVIPIDDNERRLMNHS